MSGYILICLTKPPFTFEMPRLFFSQAPEAAEGSPTLLVWDPLGMEYLNKPNEKSYYSWDQAAWQQLVSFQLGMSV